MTTSQVPEPCTNLLATRRHLSIDLASFSFVGRRGYSLCKEGGLPHLVYDQEGIDAQMRRGYGPTAHLDLLTLPLCKKCERVAAKTGGEHHA